MITWPSAPPIALGDLRREVVDALANVAPAGVSVTLGPARSIHLPTYVVSPGVPYVRPTEQAPYSTSVVTLLVYVLVGAEVTDPVGALEQLADVAVPALSAGGPIRNATYEGITELGSLIDGPGGVPCRMAVLELNVKR